MLKVYPICGSKLYGDDSPEVASAYATLIGASIGMRGL